MTVRECTVIVTETVETTYRLKLDIDEEPRELFASVAQAFLEAEDRPGFEDAAEEVSNVCTHRLIQRVSYNDDAGDEHFAGRW